MKFGEAATLIPTLSPDIAILLLGSPGTGKSTLATRVGQDMGEDAKIVVRDLASHLPEDLLGLPYRENNTTHYAPPRWLSYLSTDGSRGVLILDDLAAAAPAVQVAAFQLLLERRAGDCVLADGVRIIATANRREDRSGAATLPAALRNRCIIIEVEPDLEEWCAWAVQQGIPSEIPAFLRYRPALFSTLPKDASSKGAFATPRSWYFCGRVLDAAKKSGRVLDVAEGLVGNAASEFVAFMRLRAELPDPRRVLDDPRREIPSPPKKPDELIALVTALGEFAASLDSKDAPSRLLHALAYVGSGGGGMDACAAGIFTYLCNGGHQSQLVDAARRHKETLAPLLRFLQAALKP
jgi:hypothetical protein